ncbi:hypothetical protein JZ751_026902 [Albula glossodonta]|uniref:Uncharacterized protein n=1 Tax=Albula glossodonta TaxID=121402 RepID=A0A8T2PFN2_9TELE|nr:hypothetical protein JZ751_026902 [Albula glossodonta]
MNGERKEGCEGGKEDTASKNSDRVQPCPAPVAEMFSQLSSSSFPPSGQRSWDVLPFTLKIPEAIAAAKTQTDLEEVAQLGAGRCHGTISKTGPREFAAMSSHGAWSEKNRRSKNSWITRACDERWPAAGKSVVLMLQTPEQTPGSPSHPGLQIPGVGRVSPLAFGIFLTLSCAFVFSEIAAPLLRQAAEACGVIEGGKGSLRRKKRQTERGREGGERVEGEWTRRFWDSDLGSRRRSLQSPSRTASTQGTVQLRRQPEGQKAPPCDTAPVSPRARTPSQSNAALCFINPLFLQVHRPEGDPETDPEPSPPSKPRPRPPGPPVAPSNSSGSVNTSRANGKSRSPPPRPPPPRTLPRRPAPPLKQRSMPETACWARHQPQQQQHKQQNQNQNNARRAPMGSKFSSPSSSSSTTSSSTTKKPASAPIPVPPPRRGVKKQLSAPDLDAHRCQIALEDQTIEKALSRSRAKLQLRRAVAMDDDCSPSPPGGSEDPSSAPHNGRGEGRGQRLSDMSISTSSSDSLEYSPSFSLSGPSPPQRDSSEEEEDEEDYGVSVESDQEAGIHLHPPFKSKKRHGGVSNSGGGTTFILPRALKGQFRKVSGVFNSFMTPEKRAVRRIAELSRDKSSYFGCLVQDYVSFLQENHGCHTSGLDLLQTLRQFMTQMKAYLRQTSELDPPIESLIPEDQIGEARWGEESVKLQHCPAANTVIRVGLRTDVFVLASALWHNLSLKVAS